jgi:RimJ/RimL family protein N-acetyltransferase
MQHIIVYEGLVGVSLGLMQKSYGEIFVPLVNRRDEGIQGTLQRPPYTQKSFEAFVDGLEESKGKDEAFAVLLHEETGGTQSYRYIGHTGIHGIKWPPGIGTTGSMIVESDLRGAGHGTEAKLLLLRHCFTSLGLIKVHSCVKDFNAKSLGHLLKVGYSIWGRSRKNLLHNGSMIDEIFLEVFREDFERIWSRYQETKTIPRLTPEQRAMVGKETTRM